MPSQIDLEHRSGSADGLLATENLALGERFYSFSSLLSFRYGAVPSAFTAVNLESRLARLE